MVYVRWRTLRNYLQRVNSLYVHSNMRGQDSVASEISMDDYMKLKQMVRNNQKYKGKKEMSIKYINHLPKNNKYFIVDANNAISPNELVSTMRNMKMEYDDKYNQNTLPVLSANLKEQIGNDKWLELMEYLLENTYIDWTIVHY